MIQQVVIGGVGVPAACEPMPGSVMERAQIAAHALLGDLELLARVAAEQTGGPIAFTAAESALEPGGRIAQWASLARVAASMAAEGAAPERWQPIFDGLDERPWCPSRARETAALGTIETVWERDRGGRKLSDFTPYRK